jgi:hypothetical protein
MRGRYSIGVNLCNLRMRNYPQITQIDADY